MDSATANRAERRLHVKRKGNLNQKNRHIMRSKMGMDYVMVCGKRVERRDLKSWA